MGAGLAGEALGEFGKGGAAQERLRGHRASASEGGGPAWLRRLCQGGLAARSGPREGTDCGRKWPREAGPATCSPRRGQKKKWLPAFSSAGRRSPE